jgi:phosphoribosylglycinamide formyltransferase-1
LIRIGLVCSAGGAVVGAAMEIFREQGYPVSMSMVTDRACGAENLAREFGIPHQRIAYNSREQFSRDAANWLYGEQEMTSTCLFFSRLVSRELFDRGSCYNFHPALLPAFGGMKGLERAAISTVRFFGTTVHHVDETVDGGPIVGQIVSPVPVPEDLTAMQRISFAQKLYMLLVLAERLTGLGKQAPHIATPGGRWHLASPGLSSEALERAFVNYINEVGIPWNP